MVPEKARKNPRLPALFSWILAFSGRSVFLEGQRLLTLIVRIKEKGLLSQVILDIREYSAICDNIFRNYFEFLRKFLPADSRWDLKNICMLRYVGAAYTV